MVQICNIVWCQYTTQDQNYFNLYLDSITNIYHCILEDTHLGDFSCETNYWNAGFQVCLLGSLFDWLFSKANKRLKHDDLIIICDVIKQNESELANTVFKIQLIKAIVSFVSYCLFSPSTVCIFGTNCPISGGFHQIKA